MSHPFDFVPCTHEPNCPSWWNCARRGRYIAAKARLPDHLEGYPRGFGEGSRGQPSTDGREIGSEYPKESK